MDFIRGIWEQQLLLLLLQLLLQLMMMMMMMMIVGSSGGGCGGDDADVQETPCGSQFLVRSHPDLRDRQKATRGGLR